MEIPQKPPNEAWKTIVPVTLLVLINLLLIWSLSVVLASVMFSSRFFSALHLIAGGSVFFAFWWLIGRITPMAKPKLFIVLPSVIIMFIYTLAIGNEHLVHMANNQLHQGSSHSFELNGSGPVLSLADSFMHSKSISLPFFERVFRDPFDLLSLKTLLVVLTGVSIIVKFLFKFQQRKREEELIDRYSDDPERINFTRRISDRRNHR